MGSWPGTDVRETLGVVRDLLANPGDGAEGLPYLPELPDRGPGADLVGRGLGMLVDLPVDLQPSGWRLTDRPGHDQNRTGAFLREDLDELAEAFDVLPTLLDNVYNAIDPNNGSMRVHALVDKMMFDSQMTKEVCNLMGLRQLGCSTGTLQDYGPDFGLTYMLDSMARMGQGS
mgnify:CR=1 FL=1